MDFFASVIFLLYLCSAITRAHEIFIAHIVCDDLDGAGQTNRLGGRRVAVRHRCELFVYVSKRRRARRRYGNAVFGESGRNNGKQD